MSYTMWNQWGIRDGVFFGTDRRVGAGLLTVNSFIMIIYAFRGRTFGEVVRLTFKLYRLGDYCVFGGRM